MQIKVDVDIPRWLTKLQNIEDYNSKEYSAFLVFTRDGDIILSDGFSLFHLTRKSIGDILTLKEKYKAPEEREKYAKAYKFQEVPREAFKSAVWELDWENDELIYGNSRTKLEQIRVPNIFGVWWDIIEGKQALLGINAWTDEHRQVGVIKKAPLTGILAIDEEGHIEEATQGLLVLPMLVKLSPAMWKEGYYLGFAWYKSEHHPVIVELLRDEGNRAGWILVMPSRK